MKSTKMHSQRPYENVLFALAAAALLGACGEETATGAADGDCPDPTTTGSGGATGAGGSTSATSGSTSSATTGTGSSGTTTPGSESGNNEFDHMNDPGESGQKDPYEILKERAEEGPAEIRTRLHGCTKLKYPALGDVLTSRGVSLAVTAPDVGGPPDTAAELYNEGKFVLGVGKFDAREADKYFHSTDGATKLFDIFVQASTEIINNIQNAEACKVNGVGAPMFDTDGTCNSQALSCIMGRPAKEQDLILCDLIVGQNDGTATDILRKRQVAVAVFLSAAHTCE